MRAGGRDIRNNCAEPGPVQALFDGDDLWLPRVNRDWAGQPAGPAMSAMPRKRRLAVKMSPVAMGHEATWRPHCIIWALAGYLADTCHEGLNDRAHHPVRQCDN